MANFFTGLGNNVDSATSFAQRTIDGIVSNTLPNVQNQINQATGNLGNLGGSALLPQDSSVVYSPVSEFPGGVGQSVPGAANGSTVNSGADSEKDFRVKLRAQPAAISQVYGENQPDNILAPLYITNGLLFPYTPIIDWGQQVEYKMTSLTHSNQDYYSYSNTPSTNIRVSGEFSVQNQHEGAYVLAVIHFLRTVSKMYFGKPINGYPSGMPPPVLLFSGYGNYMFNDLPVIVKEHSYSLTKDVDYLDVNLGNGNMARLPAAMTISMTLIVQNTPRKQREEFNLDKFRTGELMRNGNKGWI